MKKNIKYILVSIIIMLAFICRVNADFSCDSSITVTETSPADYAGFETVLPICGKQTYQKHVDIHNGDVYPEVKAFAYEEVGYYYKATDNKDTHYATAPRCDHKLTMINAVISFRMKVQGKWTCPDGYEYDGKAGTAFDQRCMKTTSTDLCKGNTSKAACDFINDKYNGSYCYWQPDPTTPPSGSPSSSTPVSKPGGGNPKPSSGTVDNYNRNGIRRVSAGNVVQSSGTCKRNAYYEEVDKRGPDDYTCPEGYTKYNGIYTAGSIRAIENRMCAKIFEYTTKYECLKQGYGYTGHVGENSCKEGLKDDHIDEHANNLLDSYVRVCNDQARNQGAISAGDLTFDCDKIGVDYILWCPQYTCEIEDRRIHACTPSFSAKGAPAYCVNPSDSFGGAQAKYKVDKSFSVTDCSNSYNTVDCGYANILIEGNYHKLNETDPKAIEMAMRLWSVHTGMSSGFEGPGLSLRQGSSCSKSVWYMRRYGQFYNVYKQTYNYAINHFFSYAHDYFKGDGYLDSKNEYSNFGITCNAINQTTLIMNNPRSKYGVACAGHTTYKRAIALLYNTFLGNRDMKAHLYSLYGGHIPHDPVYAEFHEDNANKKHTVYVRFEEEQYDEVFTHYGLDEVNCDTLTGNEPYYNEIAPYCQTRIALLNDDLKEIPLYDKNGKPVYEERMQYCKKVVGCQTREVLTGVVICEKKYIEKTPVKIKTIYSVSKVSESVSKYIACGVGTRQLLYGFIGLSENEINTKININVIKEKERGEKEFEIAGFICKGNGFCKDYDPKISMNNTCSNDLKNYNDKFTSSIKDPSLKCIMNFRNITYKDYYDYSSYFHVNTSICRIFCSDEVDYTIADKVKERSSRNFKYDIPVTGTGFASNNKYPLSAIVKEKRTCVSEIYYNKALNNIEEVREKYGFTVQELPYGSTWKNLLSKLVSKAGNEGHRGENINQIIYDLYNCNLYKTRTTNPNDFGNARQNYDTTTNGENSKGKLTYVIKQPQDNQYGNVRYYINDLYSAAKNYGLKVMNNDCKITVNSKGVITENSCIEESNVKYDFAADVDAKKNGNEMQSTTTKEPAISKIYYCTDTKSNKCFEYKEKDKNPYSYGNGNTKNNVTSKTFSGLNNLGFTTINIPTNDYAYFDIEVEVGFFNSSRYKVMPDTGDVYYTSRNIDGNKEYLVNEAYTYPTAKEAYNKCSILIAASKETCPTDYKCLKTSVKKADRTEFNKTYRRCEISQEFKTFATFFRKQQINDKFMKAISDGQKFNCYVDVLIPVPQEETYRNVDPAKLFPYEDLGEVPKNWRTEDGKTAKAIIQATADDIGKDPDMIDVSIRLTPQQIKNIQSYNSRSTTPDYIDDPIVRTSCKIVPDSYDKKGNLIERGYYYDCESNFLNKIRTDKSLGTVLVDTY